MHRPEDGLGYHSFPLERVEEAIRFLKAQGKHSNIGTLAFAVGFGIMMALDVALG